MASLPSYHMLMFETRWRHIMITLLHRRILTDDCQAWHIGHLKNFIVIFLAIKCL